MTEYTTLTIAATRDLRGNAHGYTASDYATDAAAEINRRLSERGVSSWPADAIDAAEQEHAARAAAEREIAECDEMFRGRLTIAITIESVEVPE